ncbi:Bax inhibitor 1 [Coemansia javaensis]|uniref:Bax inhibitor 1 n=1 Tax=Coemansia javaensis TaxID=2761396 RepID=A0A9W8H9G0_9FUNG|nr:Bax inhibitor 1 [Coemansia javaensis]
MKQDAAWSSQASSSRRSSSSQGGRLSQRVRDQVVEVYLTLAATASSALGGYMVAERVAAVRRHELAAAAAAAGLALALFLVPATAQNVGRRRGLLWGLGAAAGAVVHSGVGPLVRYGRVGVVQTALGLTVALFSSFAAAVMASSRPQAIYAIGAAAFAISSLGWLTLLGALFPSAAMLDLSMLLGLAVPCISVAVHTQNMLDHATQGHDLDPVTYAVGFFGDLMEIFIRLMALLNNSDSARRRAQQDDGDDGEDWQRRRRTGGGGKRRFFPQSAPPGTGL